VLAVGTLFALAILTEIPHFNGPDYWQWPWRTLSYDRAAVHFAAPLLFLVYLLRTWWSSPDLTSKRAGWLVAGLVGCSMLFQYASLHADRRGRRVIPEIVNNTGVTSYFTDAQNIEDLSTWLPNFANLELEHHSETHPPGPILFWYTCIQLFGERHAPLGGAILIGMLASLGVALIYLLGSLWTPDRSARIGPCFLFALLPSILGFVPELDQVYPVGSMAMLIFWHKAFERRRAAIWLGLTLFAVSLMAYNFVTLGAMMVLYALLRLHREHWNKAAFHRVALASGIAIGVALTAHVLLWAATSYHAIDSLRASLETQEVFAEKLNRPYWQCVVWDIYDFLLGSGMLTLPLIALSLRRHLGELEVPIDRAVTVVAIASILIIDFTGLLRCEAARVWLFLQPLIIVPAGLQLARYNLADRGLIIAMQAVIAIVLRCKLAFIDI
jgi:hypothetical protein